MILVSACLLGVNCRYDGENSKSEEVLDFIENSNECVIPVCPEQLGGLSTPRPPTRLTEEGKKVLNGDGKAIMKDEGEVTSQFVRGARESLKLAKLFDANRAILKGGSPSCGSEEFPEDSGGRGSGMGITAALLDENGIEIIGEDEL